MQRGIAAEEREPAPALGVLDRLEQEPFAVADQLHERRQRRLEIGEHLAPHRHDRVLAAQRDELVERRSYPPSIGPSVTCAVGHTGPGAAPLPKARKKHVRSPVWQAPRPFLLDDEQQHVHVAVVHGARARTGGRPTSRPCTSTRRRLRLQNQVRPVSSVRRSASRFIHADHQHLARRLAPARSPATRPFASNATASSSASRERNRGRDGGRGMRGSVVARRRNAVANRPVLVPCRTAATPEPRETRRPCRRTSRPTAPKRGARRRPRVPHILRAHGDERIDDWYWLRERANPDVHAYLEAENAYTDAIMRPTEPLQARIYDEIASRVQQTDTSAPVPDGPFEYYHRTEEGQQYAIHCRRPRRRWRRRDRARPERCSPRATRFLEVGGLEVDDAHVIAAYTVDTTGGERYELRFRDLATGADLADVVPDVYYGLAWADDGRTFFYVRPDAAMRPDSVWRHTLGTPAADDVVVFRDDDERFYVAIARTRSGRFVLIHSVSRTTSEAWFVPTADAGEPTRTSSPRAATASTTSSRTGPTAPTTASTSSPTPTAP